MPWKNLQRENIFLHSFVFIFLILIYWPFIGGTFFTSDDAQLILIPQFSTPITLQNFIAILTPGNHLDFYPIRDLSYFFDSLVLNTSPFLMRLENLIFLFVGYLYLFRLLTIFELNFKAKAIFSTIWIFSFYHLEQVMWLSARKDLLALVFAIISIYYFYEHQKSNAQRSSVLWLVFYILSILSKATFGLLPVFFLLDYWFIRKKTSQLKLIVLSWIIMIANALFQSWFYSNVTDMTYRLAYWDRLHISMSALGRMLLGMVYFKVNAIDFFNFGDWLSYNQQYEWIGLLFIMSALVFSIYAIVQKKYSLLNFMILIAILYFPISGLIFPHKMFYSTRYLIPLFTLIVMGIGILIKMRNINPYYFIALLILNLVCLRIDLDNWKDNTSIRLKAVSHSPEAIYPKTQLLLELMSPTARAQINKFELVKSLDEKCSSDNNLSCLRYYLISKEIFKNSDLNKSNYYWTKFMLTLNLYQYNKHDILNYMVSDGFKSPYFPITKLSEWVENKKFFTNTEERIWHVLAACITNKNAVELKNSYLKRKLIRESDLVNFIDSELSSENQKLINLCLKV